MPVYQPGIPTGTVNLDVDYQNLQGNFEQANIVYGTDHYPFDNASPNQGFHNTVTTPIISGSAHPATAAGIPKFYAMQDSTALGVIQYSRGKNNAVPSPVTKLQSTSTAIVLAPTATTNVLDFTGLARAICTLYVFDSIAGLPSAINVFWSGSAFFFTPAPGTILTVTSSASILQIKNNNASSLSNIYWTLVMNRLQ